MSNFCKKKKITLFMMLLYLTIQFRRLRRIFDTELNKLIKNNHTCSRNAITRNCSIYSACQIKLYGSVFVVQKCVESFLFSSYFFHIFHIF